MSEVSQGVLPTTIASATYLGKCEQCGVEITRICVDTRPRTAVYWYEPCEHPSNASLAMRHVRDPWGVR